MLRKGIAAMPQLADATTPGMQKINASMHMLDNETLADSKGCSEYNQDVTPLMLGPGYVSYGAITGGNCGGAHGFGGESYFTFDLATGEPVKWSKLVRGAGVTSELDATPDPKHPDVLAGPLTEPALSALYVKAYQAANPKDEQGCMEVYDNLSFWVWPQGKTGTLGVEAASTGYAARNCANAMRLTLEQAKALGFSEDFLRAVTIAHAQPGADKLASAY